MADSLARSVCLSSVLLCLAAAGVIAQTTTGNIRGTVSDADGEPLPGVTVTLITERGEERAVVTGAEGRFLLASVPPGSHSIRAELDGVAPQTVGGVRVTIAGTATVNFVLSSATFAGELTVSGESPVIDLITSTVSSNYASEFFEDIPTRRNFWDLVAVSPGMSSATEWSASQTAFGSGTTSNSWNVDGLDITHPESGGAWWFINPETIAEVQVSGIGVSAEFGNMTGAAVNVVTKSGTNELRGNFNAFLQFDALTDTNVVIDDQFPSYERVSFHNMTFTLGGPVKRDRMWFFAAAETNRDAEAEPGVDPDFPAVYNWDRFDAKLDFSFGDSSRLSLKLHSEDYAYDGSGSAYIELSARGTETGTNPAWGAGFTQVLSDSTLLEASYAGWEGDDSWGSMTGSTEAAYADYSPPGGGPTLYYGGLLFPYEWTMSTHDADVKLSHYADDFLSGEHDFRFGVGYNRGSAKTLIRASAGGPFYYRYTYEYEYYGTIYPYDYYYQYNFNPFFYGADQSAWSAFFNDSWQVTDRLTLNLGVRFDTHDGWIPSFEELDEDGVGTGDYFPEIKNVIDWSVFSPRLGFAWVATRDQRTVVRGSVGVYHDGNVSGNWNYPPPGIPPIYGTYGTSWETSGENLNYVIIFPTDLNVDPDLEPPRSVQYSLGFERQIGDTMAIGAQLVYKETKDLIGWEILDDGIYEPVPYTNPVTGEQMTLANICDDGCRYPTIRKGNRPGAGSLAPNEDFNQDYRALILTFNRRYSKGWSLMGSYTWSRSEGLIPRPGRQTQGSPLYGNLDGADPNEWINADQLLQNDREHMLRIQGNFTLPWNLDLTTSINWQTGRPAARLDRVRLDQGATFIIVEPASDEARLPNTLLVDVAIGKRFDLGRVLLKTDLQVLNVLNDDAPTWWKTLWVDPGDEYEAAYWLWPRRAMIRIGVEF
jgi:outer membrane receptor protein involved in Fe transport